MLTAEENEQISFQAFCFELEQGTVLWELDTNAAEVGLFGDKVYVNEYSGKVKVLDRGRNERK